MNIRRVLIQIREWWSHRNGTERLEISCQGIIALATLAYVSVALFQWGQMRATTKQTKRAASAAKSAAETAQNSLKATIHQFQIEQRPYLVVDKVEWSNPPSVYARATVNVTFRDIGKTPAIKVRSSIELRRYKPTDDVRDLVKFLEGVVIGLRQQFDTSQRYAGLIRLDLAPTVAQFATIKDKDERALSAQDIRDLAKSDLVFYAVGIFDTPMRGDNLTRRRPATCFSALM